MKRFEVVMVAALAASNLGAAQTKAAAPKKSVDQLTSELRACQAENQALQTAVDSLKTSLDLVQHQVRTAESSARVDALGPRTEAIAALKALNSAFQGGSSVIDYRRYFLDARVKVDALPPGSPNNEIREIADMCQDVNAIFSTNPGLSQFPAPLYVKVTGKYGCTFDMASSIGSSIVFVGNGHSCGSTIMGLVDLRLRDLK